MLNKCPVCGKDFKNLSLHFRKSSCTEHKIHLNKHLCIILEKFKSGVYIKDLCSILSYKELILFLKTNSNYHNIVSKSRFGRIKQKGIIRNKTKEIESKIISLFNTFISIEKITKMLECHEATIKKIWIKEFGSVAVKERGIKIKKFVGKMNKNLKSVEN